MRRGEKETGSQGHSDWRPGEIETGGQRARDKNQGEINRRLGRYIWELRKIDI